MRNEEEITCKIDEIRQLLQHLINEKKNLLDPEVITASHKLDDALNTYSNMLKALDK